MTTSSFVPRRAPWRRRPRWRRRSSAPSRSAGIQSPSGTRTPEVVPFQVKTTSRAKLGLGKVGQAGRSRPRSPGCRPSFSCLVASVTQPLPKLSQASRSTPRAPSSDHSAISTAPVSEAGHDADAVVVGDAEDARGCGSITSASLALPGLARCERPSSAHRTSASTLQPGRLAQGPEEKLGLRGPGRSASSSPCRSLAKGIGAPGSGASEYVSMVKPMKPEL